MFFAADHLATRRPLVVWSSRANSARVTTSLHTRAWPTPRRTVFHVDRTSTVRWRGLSRGALRGDIRARPVRRHGFLPKVGIARTSIRAQRRQSGQYHRRIDHRRCPADNVDRIHPSCDCPEHQPEYCRDAPEISTAIESYSNLRLSVAGVSGDATVVTGDECVMSTFGSRSSDATCQ